MIRSLRSLLTDYSLNNLSSYEDCLKFIIEQMPGTKDAKNNYVEIAREIVLKNIDQDKYSVFLFGSRADETCQFDSDIDIGIIGEQPLGKQYYRLINELENSLIPYAVEIVDFSKISEEFKNMVLDGTIVIWNRGKYFDQNS